MSKSIHQILNQVMAKNLKGANGRLSASAESLGGIMLVADQIIQASKAAGKKMEGTKEHSLSEVSSAANIEPRIIIEENLKTHPQMSAFMMTLSNVFMGYYLQSLQLTGNVDAATPMGILDRLNPNRGDVFDPKKFGLEEHQYLMKNSYTLPNFKRKLPKWVATEAFKPVAGAADFVIEKYLKALEEEGTPAEEINALREMFARYTSAEQQARNPDDIRAAKEAVEQQERLIEQLQTQITKLEDHTRAETTREINELEQQRKALREELDKNQVENTSDNTNSDDTGMDTITKSDKDAKEKAERRKQTEKELERVEGELNKKRQNLVGNATEQLRRHLDAAKEQLAQLKANMPQGPKVSQQAMSQALKGLNDANNLAVGRWIQVTLTLQGHQVEIPVALRMRPMFAATIIMRELIAYGDIKESWSERWLRFKAGELSFKDWLLQSDRIRHQKKLVTLDKNGILMDMIKRRSKNFEAAVKSGQPSLGGASAMFIVSKDTMDYVQSVTGHNFDNEEIRELFFAANSAMMVVVVDDRWDRVTTYTRGVSVGSDYSIRDFAKFGKGDGPDIMEIFKAYQMGSAPRF